MTPQVGKKKALKLGGGRGERQAQAFVPTPVLPQESGGRALGGGGGRNTGAEPDGSKFESTSATIQL